MLVFKNCCGNFIYIHIPKNGGIYTRQKILNDSNNTIIKSFWDYILNFDLAHIPYIKRNKFIESNIEYNYFTHTRCPYDRIISGFFFKNPEKSINDFDNFIKNELVLYDFSVEFDSNIIHYYPQYLFVCDENLNIPKNIKIDKLENIENPRKYILKDFFDNECIKIINEIYKKDFLLFDYKIMNSV